MRIALDFDGTIADAAGAKIRYAKERWGVELTAAASMRPGAVPVLGEERYETMIRDVFGTAVSVGMEPMPGAVEAMQRLGAVHDLHIVTARFDHEGEFATQWLQRHGLEIRSFTVTNRGAKVDHCMGLGAEILLEDSPGELARFAEHDHRVAMALLETPYNANDVRPESWHIVPDWRAFEGLVEQLAGQGYSFSP